MLTGMLAVRNLIYGEKHDLWQVNADQEYHEEVREKIDFEPEITTEAVKEAFARVFPKLGRVALGLSMGTLAGILLFMATLILVLKGGVVVGPNLQLLEQYFPGYSVTLSGTLLGLGYGFCAGFAVGWGYAFFRNITAFLYMALIRRRAERLVLRKLLEYI